MFASFLSFTALIIINLLISISLMFIFRRKILSLLKGQTENTQKTYLRRGIYNSEYELLLGSQKSRMKCQHEVGEIERTEKKSKIFIINTSFSNSKYYNDDNVNLIKKLVNNSWVDSSEIEWIYESKSDERDKKIDEILK